MTQTTYLKAWWHRVSHDNGFDFKRPHMSMTSTLSSQKDEGWTSQRVRLCHDDCKTAKGQKDYITFEPSSNCMHACMQKIYRISFNGKCTKCPMHSRYIVCYATGICSESRRWTSTRCMRLLTCPCSRMTTKLRGLVPDLKIFDSALSKIESMMAAEDVVCSKCSSSNQAWHSSHQIQNAIAI